MSGLVVNQTSGKLAHLNLVLAWVKVDYEPATMGNEETSLIAAA